MVYDNYENGLNQVLMQNSADLVKLAGELEKLRTEMRGRAQDAEHDVATGQIAEAEQCAKEGNQKGVVSHLKKAGAWALDIATKVGVDVAAAAIKASLGL